MAYEVLALEKDEDGNTIVSDYRQVKFTDEETGVTATRSVRFFEDPAEFQGVLEQQERGFTNKVRLGLYNQAESEEVEASLDEQ